MPEKKTYGTSRGHVIDDDVTLALAAEAVAGYDVTELGAEIERRAEADHTTARYCCNRKDRRIVRRMPRLQVYLPDELYASLKARDLPASELLQVAVRAELERRDALEATDTYIAELRAEVGEPSKRDRARADAVVRSIRDRSMNAAG